MQLNLNKTFQTGWLQLPYSWVIMTTNRTHTHTHTHTHKFFQHLVNNPLKIQLYDNASNSDNVFCCSVISDSVAPLNVAPLCSSVHGLFQARILEWNPIFYSRGSSPPSQGSNPCLLHLLYWHMDSLPLVPSGKPNSDNNRGLNNLCLCHQFHLLPPTYGFILVPPSPWAYLCFWVFALSASFAWKAFSLGINVISK